MGIFKNLRNKILNAEVPPLVEQLVKKGLAKKGAAGENPSDVAHFSAEIINSENRREEEKKYQEIAVTVMQTVEETGFFKPEKLPELNAKITEIVQPGYGYSDPFSYEDCLSLEEKKNLGLNPHQKFSREFIDFLSLKGLSHPDPKNILKIIYLIHLHAISRKYDLARLKKLGLKTVKIEDCGDEWDCSKIKRLRKIWPIDQVPELPLPGCTAEYCRYSYIANNIFE